MRFTAGDGRLDWVVVTGAEAVLRARGNDGTQPGVLRVRVRDGARSGEPGSASRRRSMTRATGHPRYSSGDVIAAGGNLALR